MSIQPMQQFQTMFDLHRSMVAQQFEFTRDAMEAQHELLRAVGEGTDMWRAMAEQQAAIARMSTRQAMTALPEQAEGTDEMEAITEELIGQFEAANELGIDATEGTFEEATEAYHRFIEAYLDAMGEGVDAYLEATERVEEATESVATEIDVE